MLFRKRPGAVPNRSEPPPSKAPDESHSSPGLRALLTPLQKGGRYRILDLGPALGPNVEHLSHYAPKIRIVDLIRTMQSDPQLSDTFRSTPRAALQRLIPVDLGPFDLILAWDLFNYVTRDSIGDLAAHLSALCAPGAAVFCLVSTEETVPAEPIAFRIADQETLVYSSPVAETRPCPQFSLPEFESALHEFAVDKIFLLRHGIREYVLVRRDR